MKVTLYCSPAGEIITTLPHSNAYLPAELGTINDIQRIGRITEITGSDKRYSVSFIDSSLSRFNKTGFISVEAAVAYEQDVLDKYFSPSF